jgi:chemotaxis protein histidine kinase CheA
LAKVEPTSPNTLIAFAAKAGSTASDGDSKNSPFTAALVKHLPKPGLDLRKAFGFARDDVLKATNNRQEPFIYGSLGGDDVALVPALAPPPLSAADPNVSVRRDYEFAERVGTKEAWDFYLSTYPDGFYAKLAQAQRNKLAAEEARVAATEKARLAEEEQARLAVEGAKASEQAKAASQAKAAEKARMIAEEKKALEDAKVAEAERAKAAAQAKQTEIARMAAEKAKAAEEAKATQERIDLENRQALQAAKAAEVERAKATAQAKAEEEAKLAIVTLEAADEKKSRDNEEIGQLAALTPAQQAGEALARPDKAASDISRLLQIELRRVGCNTGAVDGNWDAAAQKSLLLFNKIAQTKFDVKIASLDALDAVRSKTARICPRICDHGYEPKGESCVKISCKQGYRVGDDNACEKIESKRPVTNRESSPEPQPQRPASKPTASTSTGGTCKNWLAICSSRPRSTPSICSEKYSNCLGSGCWTEGVSYGGAQHCNLKR